MPDRDLPLRRTLPAQKCDRFRQVSRLGWNIVVEFARSRQEKTALRKKGCSTKQVFLVRCRESAGSSHIPPLRISAPPLPFPGPEGERRLHLPRSAAGGVASQTCPRKWRAR